MFMKPSMQNNNVDHFQFETLCRTKEKLLLLKMGLCHVFASMKNNLVNWKGLWKFPVFAIEIECM